LRLGRRQVNARRRLWAGAAVGYGGGMCNEYRRSVALGQIEIGFSQTRIPLRFPEGLPNLAALDSIRITDPSAIIRASLAEPGAAELVQRRWSWPGPHGKPVFNFRAEGRGLGQTATSGRCLIVADGFYEYTDAAAAAHGPRKGRRKDRWLFTLRQPDAPGGWFGIAGLWRTSDVGEACTMLTVEPGPDVAPYHNRQIVVLGAADWGRWLDPAVPAGDVLRPSPAGTFDVALANA
jgi:putative SOS response-associated peptidase YedK